MCYHTEPTCDPNIAVLEALQTYSLLAIQPDHRFQGEIQ